MMKKKRVAVVHYLNAIQLAALLWEGSVNFNYGRRTFELALEDIRERGEELPDAMHRGIRMVVSEEMRHYGEASIECGPQRKWNDDKQEAWYVAVVEKVYGLA